jgi:hypothetical protein
MSGVGTPFVRAGVVPVATPNGQEVVSVNCPAYSSPGQDSNGDSYYLGFPNNSIPSNLWTQPTPTRWWQIFPCRMTDMLSSEPLLRPSAGMKN